MKLELFGMSLNIKANFENINTRRTKSEKNFSLALGHRHGTIWVESPCTGPHCNLPWSVNPDPVTE